MDKKRRNSFINLFILVVVLAAIGGWNIWNSHREARVLETDIKEISKHGNIILNLNIKDFKNAGYAASDIVEVTVGEDKVIDMPVAQDYSDVNTGEPVLRMHEADDTIVLAYNMGSMANRLDIAVKKDIEEEPGFTWIWNEGYGYDTPVTIRMLERQGYADEYELRQITRKRSNERSAYPALSDEEYANFRMIHTTGIKENTLYRSSSPVNPELNRNVRADEAMRKAGIRTVINLADTKEKMMEYPDYFHSYYAGCDVLAVNMGVDLFLEENRTKLISGLEYLIDHDGPYLIHCSEGKDRSGFMSALLESLMGASAQEIVDDYMTTYVNYYYVKRGSDEYNKIAEGTIVRMVSEIFDIKDFYEADLQKCAEDFLLSSGLGEYELDRLKEILGG